MLPNNCHLNLQKLDMYLQFCSYVSLKESAATVLKDYIAGGLDRMYIKKTYAVFELSNF